MEEGTIPANLHYKTPNPDIPALVDGRLKVVTENTPWEGGLVAINSPGLFTHSSHVILKSNDRKLNQPHEASNKVRLFTCNGRTEEGVRATLAEARKYAQNMEYQALLQERANLSSQQGPYRGYTLLNSSSVIEGVERCPSERPPVWFVFSGMGSQYSGMGKKMLELDTFRESVAKCAEVLVPYDIDLVDLLINADSKTIDQAIPASVGLSAVQVALVDMLASMDITPDGIIGHSMGETTCAYADGCVTAEQLTKVSYWRSKCIIDAKLPPGGMAAVGLTWEEAKELCPPGVVPACHNSKNSLTLAGQKEPLVKFVKDLSDKGIFARHILTDDIAYHCDMLKDLERGLRESDKKYINMTPKLRSSKWISTSVPENEWGEDHGRYCSGEYFINNALSPVLFYEGLKKVPSNALIIEIAPRDFMRSIVRQNLGSDVCYLDLMKRGHENNIEHFLSSIGRCFLNGVNVNHLKLFPPVSYPVSQGTPMISPCISQIWDHSTEWFAPCGDDFDFVIGDQQTANSFSIDITEESKDHYLNDHRIDGRAVFPSSGFLILVWRTLARRNGQEFQDMPVIFRSVQFYGTAEFPEDGKLTLSVRMLRSSGEFNVCEKDTMLASGFVSDLQEEDASETVSSSGTSHVEYSMTQKDVYKELKLRGYDYGPNFQGLQEISCTGDKGSIAWNGTWIAFLDALMQMQVLSSSTSRYLRIPTKIQSLRIDPSLHPQPPKEDQDPLVIPAYIKKNVGVVVCGGVEMNGMSTSVVQKRESQIAPTLEEYCFVPYTENIKNAFPPSLEKYATECLDFILHSFKKLLEDTNSDMLLNKDALKQAFLVSKPRNTPDMAESSKQPNSGLAQYLMRIFKLPLTKTFAADVQEVLSSFRVDLNSDRLLSGLSNQEILKPCVDIVLENVSTSIINIFEASTAQGALYPKLCPMFQCSVNVNYTVDENSLLQDEDVQTFELTTTKWPPAPAKATASTPARTPAPSTAANPSDSKIHLAVFKNVLHKQDDISKALQAASGMIADNGFILIEEMTTNFPISLALEALTDPLVCCSSDKRRVHGCYLTVAEWMEIFLDSGFEIVYKKSDNLLSTIFLLRKATKALHTNIIYPVSGFDFSWFSNLRAKLTEVQNAPPEARLWLTAKEDISGVMGLVNCLRHENGGQKLRCIMINNLKESSKRPEISVKSSEFQKLARQDLVFNIYRDGVWGSFRHLPLPSGAVHTDKSPKLQGYAYVKMQNPGDLASLRWIQSEFPPTDNNERCPDLCSVYFTGLNTRDPMLAKGSLSPEAISEDLSEQDCQFGMEFSGRDPRGKRVMGIVPSQGLATSVSTSRQFLWNIPDQWTMEEAATVPVAYSLAYYALVVRGNLRKGETVLIHSGASDLGQASISVALNYECEVFTTVATDDQKKFLRKMYPRLRDKHFSSSNDTSFVAHVLRETKGKGADLLLNCLTGERLMANVLVVARHGRFLDTSKLDMVKNSSLFMSIFLKNISFMGIMLDVLLEHPDEDWAEVHGLVRSGIEKGVVRPIKTQVFSRDQLEDAFRFVERDTHTEKAVVKIRQEEEQKVAVPQNVCLTSALMRPSCSPSQSYLIVSGQEDFGIELAQWLVDRGAKKLVLTWRSQIRSGYQKKRLDIWKEAGVTVSISQSDASTQAGVKLLLQDCRRLGPVGGVFIVSTGVTNKMVKGDATELCQAVSESKMQCVLTLDKATRQSSISPNWFVVFSCLSSGHGIPGQSAYGFANSAAERICERRRMDGLHGLAIQWGPIDETADFDKGVRGIDNMVEGTEPQRVTSCLDVLDSCLSQSYSTVSSYVRSSCDKTEQTEVQNSDTENSGFSN